MRLMGLEATHPKPGLSAGDRNHELYPYLLRDVSIERADQVWSTDGIFTAPLPYDEPAKVYGGVIEWRREQPKK